MIRVMDYGLWIMDYFIIRWAHHCDIEIGVHSCFGGIDQVHDGKGKASMMVAGGNTTQQMKRQIIKRNKEIILLCCYLVVI